MLLGFVVDVALAAPAALAVGIVAGVADVLVVVMFAV